MSYCSSREPPLRRGGRQGGHHASPLGLWYAQNPSAALLINSALRAACFLVVGLDNERTHPTDPPLSACQTSSWLASLSVSATQSVCSINRDGKPAAYFYLDPYSRPAEKRGGAWMGECAGRSTVMSNDGVRLPVRPLPPALPRSLELTCRWHTGGAHGVQPEPAGRRQAVAHDLPGTMLAATRAVRRVRY
eukprot:2115767-Rhodomonas_salina.4